MFSYARWLGGIAFRTTAEVELSCLGDILTDSTLASNVNLLLHSVGDNDLVMPPFTDAERSRMGRLVSPLRVTRANLALPAWKRQANEEPPQVKTTDSLSFPLMRSRVVRERLAACWNHPDQIAVQHHVFLFTIYDFIQRRADVFYPTERSWILNDSEALMEGTRRVFGHFFPLFLASVIHSSAVKRNGRIALFVGPDGAGKSTVSQLATDGIVFGDDRNIIRRVDNEAFVVYPSPWNKIRITDLSQRAPIGGLFLLKKDLEFGLESLSRHDLIQFLWNDNSPQWLFLPDSVRIQAFDLICALCSKLPVYRMRFPKNYVDWDAIDAAMGVK